MNYLTKKIYYGCASCKSKSYLDGKVSREINSYTENDEYSLISNHAVVEDGCTYLICVFMKNPDKKEENKNCVMW